MPEAQRYVVVSSDEDDREIKGGPYLWDGEAAWTPPEQGDLKLEADALAAGYTWPAPVESYVTVDEQTMTITGGPWQWNGQGDPPAEGTLMREQEAQSAGYTWP